MARTLNKRNPRHKTRHRKTRKQMRNKRRISRRYSRRRVMRGGVDDQMSSEEKCFEILKTDKKCYTYTDFIAMLDQQKINISLLKTRLERVDKNIIDTERNGDEKKNEIAKEIKELLQGQLDRENDVLEMRLRN